MSQHKGHEFINRNGRNFRGRVWGQLSRTWKRDLRNFSMLNWTNATSHEGNPGVERVIAGIADKKNAKCWIIIAYYSPQRVGMEHCSCFLYVVRWRWKLLVWKTLEYRNRDWNFHWTQRAWQGGVAFIFLVYFDFFRALIAFLWLELNCSLIDWHNTKSFDFFAIFSLFFSLNNAVL